MTRDRNFKRLVRDRMRASGESYTVVRRHVLQELGVDIAEAEAATSRPELGRDPSARDVMEHVAALEKTVEAVGAGLVELVDLEDRVEALEDRIDDLEEQLGDSSETEITDVDAKCDICGWTSFGFGTPENARGALANHKARQHP